MRGFQSVSGKNYSSRLVPDFGSVQTGEPTDEKKLSGGIVLDINKSNKYVWGIQNIASMHCIRVQIIPPQTHAIG